MHNLNQFVLLLQDEIHAGKDMQSSRILSIQDLKDGFPNIARIAGIPLENIEFAYVAGSYSRGNATAFSDIDIECFSDKIESEYQDTFKWNDALISFSIYPMNSVRGEHSNIVDRSWARSVFINAKPIYDPKNHYSFYTSIFLKKEIVEADIDTSLAKHMRKILEYRRKMFGSLNSDDKILYNYSTAKFIENYAVVKNILLYNEITSEKGQFDILKDVTVSNDKGLLQSANKLFNQNIKMEECVSLTEIFMSDMILVAKEASVSHHNALLMPSALEP